MSNPAFMSVCLVGDRRQLRSLHGKKLHPHQEKDVPSVGATGWGHRSVLVFKQPFQCRNDMYCIAVNLNIACLRESYKRKIITSKLR